VYALSSRETIPSFCLATFLYIYDFLRMSMLYVLFIWPSSKWSAETCGNIYTFEARHKYFLQSAATFCLLSSKICLSTLCSKKVSVWKHLFFILLTVFEAFRGISKQKYTALYLRPHKVF
jgi:hypothetical protein